MENSCWSLNTILGENPDSTNLGNPVVVFSLLLCLPDKPLTTRSNNPDNSVTRWPNHSSAPECYPNVSSGLIADRCWRGIHNWGHPHYQHRSYHRSCHKCRSSCRSCSSRARGHPCHSSSSCDRGSYRWHWRWTWWGRTWRRWWVGIIPTKCDTAYPTKFGLFFHCLDRVTADIAVDIFKLCLYCKVWKSMLF